MITFREGAFRIRYTCTKQVQKCSLELQGALGVDFLILLQFPNGTYDIWLY